MMVAPAQSILHGGAIASALDVAAGLVCVGSTLTRHDTIDEGVAPAAFRMGTIDLRVDYLRPGRGERFTATSTLPRAGNKVAVARVELHNEAQVYIASATASLYGGLIRQSSNITLFGNGFYRWMRNDAVRDHLALAAYFIWGIAPAYFKLDLLCSRR